jgi:histidinol phosphatase-like enzyme (inositol monophosphatase family)
MSLSAQEIQEYRRFAERLADEAALAILPYFRAPLEVEDKGGARFDPVTEADRAAERVMRELIGREYPGHGILGEEHGTQAGADGLTWVLDPIDGTRAFITGLPLWGTLIALNDGTRPVVGVMNQPYTKERYVGTPEGAWLNGEPLATRPCPDLDEARVMSTSPELFETPARRAAFEAVAREAKLARYGGDCYAYCMVAAGLVDAVIESGLKPWDVQALVPIIEGAGGVVSAWDGGDAQNGGTVLACGDPVLHVRLVERLKHAA